MVKHSTEIEEQRLGRNKETVIDHMYISGGEFRKKFDLISNDKALNRLLYKLAKKMLEHRSGTLLEDMYWIDIDECQVVGEETQSIVDSKIVYSDNTRKMVESYRKNPEKSIITIHSHPSSFPPSIDDFMSNYDNDYSLGIVVCHNGDIYLYEASEELNSDYYNLVVANYLNDGYNNYESQLKAIEEFQKNFNITCKEVKVL